MAITITKQDKSLLNLIAKGEAKSYNTVYGGKEIPLNQMTLAEVLRWQTGRKPSTAAGRYQMLKQTVIDCTKLLKVDPTQTRFTPTVQDAMILKRLESSRSYNRWKAGKLGSTERENCEKFMINLAKEFASVPVPYALKGQQRQVSKGQSYYAGDGLNKAHHNPDSFLAALIDIYRGGPGTNVSTVDISNGSVDGSNGYSTEGESPLQRMTNFATGGGRYRRREGGAADEKGLPTADNVYVYEVIDPLDCRYDFRTGKKVVDLTLYGTASVAEHNQANSGNATDTPASQLGVSPADGVEDLDNWTEEEVNELMDSRDRAATSPGRYSDFFDDPYDPTKLLTVPGRLPPTPTPGSTPTRAPPTDGLTGVPEKSSELPNPTSQPLATETPVSEQTNKRNMAITLQQDLDKEKRDVNNIINNMQQIIDKQVEIYAGELQIQLNQAENNLADSKITLQEAINSGNTVAINAAQKAVFANEGKVKIIKNKLTSGSPYGLSTSEKQTKAKNDTGYQQLLNSLTTIVNSKIPKIVNQSKSLGIDLKQDKITAQLNSVPPIVKFS